MISFPYTSVKTMSGSTPKYDRAIDSATKRLYNKLRYTQGVAVDIGDGFQVVADSGMNVKVKCNGAWAHVGGDFCYESAESRVLSVQAPDTTYDRIDRVVIRNDISQEVRAADLYIVQGTPASSPEAPALTNTPEIQEIGIATLFITRNVNTISQDRISDTRLDSKVCGVLTNAFGEIDASQFFAQLEQLAKDLEEEIKGIHAGTEMMLKAEYDPNGESIDVTVQTYTHTKSGTVHEFTGNGANGRAKMTADVQAGDTFTVNGSPVTAYMGAENAVDVMAGSAYNGKWVSFIVEGGTLNFKGGGGKVTVTGLDAAAVKTGVTVAVKQGAKVIKNVVGTFTADATAAASQMLQGVTAYVRGAKVTGTIPSKAAATYTPKTTNQTIAAGQYLAGAQTIAGDPDLVAANILEGKNIFGVSGGLTVLAAGSNYGKNNAAFSGSWWYNGMQTVNQGNFTGSFTFPGTPVIAFVMKENTYASVTIGGQTVKKPGVTTITTFSNNSVSWSAGSDNDGIVYVVLGTA